MNSNIAASPNSTPPQKKMRAQIKWGPEAARDSVTRVVAFLPESLAQAGDKSAGNCHRIVKS
jgi:hypothetical protein